MTHDDERLHPTDKDSADDWIDLMLHSRSDQSDHQHDLPDSQLLQELQALSREQAQAVNHRVERVWRQLEARARLSAEGQRQALPPARPISSQERRPPMKKPMLLVQAAQRWSTRLSAVAAAVLLVALVGGLIFGLVLVRHSGSPTAQTSASATRASTPPATATPEGRSVPVLENLTMLDAQHGWALNVPEQIAQTGGTTTISAPGDYHVLITSDGGSHWRDVTPPEQQRTPLGVDFVTASLAWVFSGANQLYVTTNSGQTWQQATTPIDSQYNSWVNFTFINAQDGWIILQGASGGMALFGTTDGGQHWSKLQSTDAQGNSQPGGLPLKYFTSLSFIDASTGWATGENARSDGVVRLYVTHDGGATWQPQNLRLPAQGFSGPTVNASAPEFFNAQDGILDVGSSTAVFQPDVAGHPQSGVLGRVIYVTHDGGATWQSGALLPDPAGAVSFADADHGWLASSTNADLWATSDGGRTWTKIASGSLAAYAGGGNASYNYLNFVSPQIGWAEQQGTDYSTLLFKTTDGGRTWTQINFSISG